MVKELSIKAIYDDFLAKAFLTPDEKKVLDMLLQKYSIIKMSDELHVCDRNISKIVHDLKEKYSNYKKIEMAKLDIFKA